MVETLLILAPDGHDATVVAQALHTAGIDSAICPTLQALCLAIDSCAGVVLAEEAMSGADLPCVLDWVAAQPPWSDLAFVVLAADQGPGRTGRRWATLEALGNTMLVERPLHGDSLVSAGRAAVRARRRQLAMRELTDTLEIRVAERTQALAESEARFRAIFEGFPESLFVLCAEPDGRFIYESRNPAAGRRTGLPADLVIGRTPDAILDPGQAATVNQALRRCIETGASVEVSNDMRFPAGTATYDVTLTPLFGPDGQVTRILGVARDVTERNRLESRLRQAQKLEAVGQLTGGVAHDFNNLLQVVLSGLTLMERVHDPARRTQLADSVRRAAQRGGELTRRLLTVARRQSLRPESIDLGAWLDDGAGELLSRGLRGDIVLERRIDPGLPPIQADPVELELAILNIAVNARDAMPEGGTLTISAETVCLDAAHEPEGLDGTFVRLSISDTGTGMTPEIMARVFEPFFTTKEVGRGTGLGLAQIHGFARQSGGSVRLRSAPGEGTTVSLLLPLAHQDATQRTPPSQTSGDEADGGEIDNPMQPAKVLVVEDDEDVAALVIEMLAQLGHQSLWVSTAAAALGALADGRPFDLLFSDVMMPGGMDGLALAREAARRRPGIRVLLTTGYTGGGPGAAPLGVPVLRKPYRLNDLALAVATILAPEPTSLTRAAG